MIQRSRLSHSKIKEFRAADGSAAISYRSEITVSSDDRLERGARKIYVSWYQPNKSSICFRSLSRVNHLAGGVTSSPQYFLLHARTEFIPSPWPINTAIIPVVIFIRAFQPGAMVTYIRSLEIRFKTPHDDILVVKAGLIIRDNFNDPRKL